ncbi:hemolymph lipopolysaccharide-binding protein [Anabrus simplex]|uniref:hemolymph lipopolysaccharide-binding protein n=1 Tax=Anabrus simplex TaxID=316456 RepID=UPI0035A3100B
MDLHLSTWLLLGTLVVGIFSYEQQCPSIDTSGFSMKIVSHRDAKGHWKVSTKSKQLSPQDGPRDLVIDVGQFSTPCGDSEIVEWVSTVSLDPNQELNHSTTAEESAEGSTSKYTLVNPSTEQGITNAEGVVYSTDYQVTTESTLMTSTTTFTASHDGYVEFPGFGFIKVHKDRPVTWDVANDTCVMEGAQLVYVDSDRKSEVFEALYLKYWKKASSTSGRYYVIHVGFHDRFRKGDYVTVSGNRVDETRWAPGQPTGVEGHCGSARFDGMMYVVSCELETYFFCEKHGVK